MIRIFTKRVSFLRPVVCFYSKEPRLPKQVEEKLRKQHEEKVKAQIDETEKIRKQMENDPVWIAYEKESEQLEEQIWLNYHIKHSKEKFEDVRDYRKKMMEEVKPQILKTREMLTEKYKLLSQMVKQDRQSPEYKYANEALAKVLLNDEHFNKNADYQALVDLVEREGGEKIKRQNFTKEEVEEFIEFIQSEKGDELAKRIDNILTDEKFAELDIDLNQVTKTGDIKLPELEDYQFENMKHALMKDLDKHPGYKELIEEQLGQSVEDLFKEMEKATVKKKKK